MYLYRTSRTTITTVSSLATSSTIPAAVSPSEPRTGNVYPISAKTSETTAPNRNSVASLCSETFRGLFISKKNVSVVSGTANAPRIITAGTRFPASDKCSSVNVKTRYEMTIVASTRKKSHGFGQPACTRSIGGVVFLVPTAR